MTDDEDHVLILRTCDADMTSHGGFAWPEAGPVECPDWDPTPRCGGGLRSVVDDIVEGKGGELVPIYLDVRDGTRICRDCVAAGKHIDETSATADVHGEV